MLSSSIYTKLFDNFLFIQNQKQCGMVEAIFELHEFMNFYTQMNNDKHAMRLTLVGLNFENQ